MTRKVNRSFSKIFSQRLNFLMKNKKIKSVELAKILGVTPQSVGQFKTEVSVPKIETLIKLANFFDVSIDYLLGRTDVKTTDISVRLICEYLHITEECVNQLHTNKENFLKTIVDDFSNKLKSMF